MAGFSVYVPFVEMLGFELVFADAGRAELGLTLRPELTNARNMAHGGVLMTLLDVAMANAARSAPHGDRPETRGVVTIEMKTSFMRPGAGRLRALGEVMHRGGAMAFCEGTVLDAGDKVVAKASGTFKYVLPLAPAGRPRQPLDASE